MNKKNEIEVTEEMLAAARHLLPTEDRNEVLANIYRAMREEWHKVSSKRAINRRMKYLQQCLDNLEKDRDPPDSTEFRSLDWVLSESQLPSSKDTNAL